MQVILKLFFFFNMRVIFKNFDEFCHDFCTDGAQYNFLCFPETRLTLLLLIYTTFLTFNFISNECNSHGGGVRVDLSKQKNTLFQIIPEVTIMSDLIETIFIRFALMGVCYVIGCVYRPPNSKLSCFLNEAMGRALSSLHVNFPRGHYL